MIAESSIAALLETVDIVDTIDSYLILKKSGANFKASCPFHDEKSASFTVSPQKQIFKCFGCGVGGNAIKFVQDLERLTFPEAVEKLAADNNFTLEHEGGSRAKPISSDVLEQYCKWCESNLRKNNQAQEYLESRGLTADSISAFEIGLSPSTQEVLEFVRSTFMDLNQCLELDIVREGDRGLYATFTNRIMFPIRNASGKLCGFSGRTLVDHKAKYLNTKDTPLFNKSSILFGFHQAKEWIAKKSDAILTEGQLDVVMMHQAGLTNTVASMGTALTKAHIPVLSRVTKRCSLMFDGDNAGANAAFKAATTLMQSQMDVGVAIVDEGEDPADMVAAGNVDGIRNILRNQTHGIEFCANRILVQFDLRNPFQKQSAMAETAQYSQGLSLIVKEHFLAYVSSQIGYIEPIEYRPNIERSRSTWEMLQLSIIKTILDGNQKADISELKEIVNCFTYKDAVQSIVDGTVSDEMIGEIYLDDTIPILESLERNILSFKMTCLKKWMDLTRVSDRLPAVQKVEKMREAQIKLQELERKFKDLEYG